MNASVSPLKTLTNKKRARGFESHPLRHPVCNTDSLSNFPFNMRDFGAF